jgi:hypothetical protein
MYIVKNMELFKSLFIISNNPEADQQITKLFTNYTYFLHINFK